MIKRKTIMVIEIFFILALPFY